jgi:hypothetical protein
MVQTVNLATSLSSTKIPAETNSSLREKKKMGDFFSYFRNQTACYREVVSPDL